MMDLNQAFCQEVCERIASHGNDNAFGQLSAAWMDASIVRKYSYNFSWLGRPIIQYPQDMVAVQELVWRVKPDLIVETGIAHGGSLILSASMLALLDICEALELGGSFEPRKSDRKILGIDIRMHNREAIRKPPLSSYVEMIEGSSVDSAEVDQVHERSSAAKSVMVFLDSNHTHDHVLSELKAYATLVTADSYCVVFDTLVDRLPKEYYPDRPWGPGDNPMTAVGEFLQSHSEFEIDRELDTKLQISGAPNGYLRRRSSP